MARGEYSPAFVGNGARLPEAMGTYRSYAVVFRERVDELDAAIQQADRDYATKYQTDWRATGQKPGEGLDQSRFVFAYWLPFAKAWNVARAQLLAGKMDPAAALVLLSWAGRFNDLKMDAGASWGLDTTAPNVMIRGSSPGAVALGYDSATSADNSHRGEARRVVAELARQLWNSPSRDTVVAFGYMLGPTGTVVQEFGAPRPPADRFWFAKDWYQNAIPHAGYVAWFDARDVSNPRAEHFGTVTMLGAVPSIVGAVTEELLPAPVMQALAQETNDSFWKETGYKPGHRLEYPEDADMMPVWLAIHYAVVTRHLNAYRFTVPSDPAVIQRLAAYQHQLAARFAADPSRRRSSSSR